MLTRFKPRCKGIYFYAQTNRWIRLKHSMAALSYLKAMWSRIWLILSVLKEAFLLVEAKEHQPLTPLEALSPSSCKLSHRMECFSLIEIFCNFNLLYV